LVACAKDRLIGDSCDLPVNTPPPLAEILVEHRRQQRVDEANRPVLALDHMRLDRGLEGVCCNARPSQERLGWRAEDRGERERLAGGGREIGDPCA
jgi:hypothetical protein